MTANIGASVKARLLNLAKLRNEDANYIILRYFQERFLYRLCQSPHADRFVLNGIRCPAVGQVVALLGMTWRSPTAIAFCSSTPDL